MVLEFPQNVIGWLGYVVFAQILGCPTAEYKDSIVTRCGRNWGAVSLGKYIFMSHDMDSEIIKHEYGHSLQSKKLKFLYIPIIGIPSLIWAGCFKEFRKKHNVSYYSFYTEKWANKLGEYKG